ncbi:hypothetical protein Scep_011998 [Stephania cephalantha]|uniref:Uncharacterized protein n=1 Tax=Stephania cephalantha TaxID=152367 RepID=A0AAP0JF84_9MAGN
MSRRSFAALVAPPSHSLAVTSLLSARWQECSRRSLLLSPPPPPSLSFSFLDVSLLSFLSFSLSVRFQQKEFFFYIFWRKRQNSMMRDGFDVTCEMMCDVM